MSDRPVALVTGAARRIGRAIALELAAAGQRVAVHYRSSAADAQRTVEDLRQCGVDAQAFHADLSSEGACRVLIDQVLDHFQRLDNVVNSASHFEYDDPASFSWALAQRHWQSNTAPAITLATALHSHLVARERRGCVVNLLDQKLWNPNPDYFSYTLSKAALQCATIMLAQALAPALRVCGVAPGVTLVSGPMSAEEFAQAHQMTPLARSSTPQDVARAVRFLIDAPAITGTTLLVDGGQHLSAQARDVLYLAKNS